MARRVLYFSSVAVSCATWILLIAGGLVTSTGSGLSVPDWPLSYGQLFPPMIGGIRFEHTHRLIAGTVGLLTLGLTALFIKKEKRAWVRTLAGIASGAIILQAVLGGITVKYLLPTAVSVAHACLGQSFFCLVAALALFTSKEWQEAPSVDSPYARSFQRLSLTTTLFIFSQLIVGAFVRHSDGRGIEAHFFLAFFIIIHVIFLNLKIFKDSALSRLFLKQILWKDAMVLIQIFFGLGSFIYKLALEKAPSPRFWEVIFTTVHQSTGALIFANSALMTLRAAHFFRGLKKEPYPSEYLELMKPRVTLMALATTWVGYALASNGPFSTGKLWHTLLGAFLIGGGANALNQFLEREVDSKMSRTENRPLPSRRLSARHALVFGWVVSILGVGELSIFVSPVCGILGGLVFLTYVFFYTPLKRITTLNTFVGAVPGALPIVLGYVAGKGRNTREALALFLILFLWQLPHFFAIAWVYREDYRSSGLRMLPAEDSEGHETARHILFYSALLIPATLLPYRLGLSGTHYFLTALVSGFAFLAFAFLLKNGRLSQSKKFVKASLYYLFVLMVALVVDKS